MENTVKEIYRIKAKENSDVGIQWDLQEKSQKIMN